MANGKDNLKNPLPKLIFEERVSVPKWQKNIINVFFSIQDGRQMLLIKHNKLLMVLFLIKRK